MDHPSGIVLDASNNLYITDTENHRIRKVTSSTGIIDTIAGNGTGNYSGDGGLAISAELNRPIGIVIDSSNDIIYFADAYNHAIRKITLSTGVIDTFAGSGVNGYSGDGGAATSARIHRPHGLAIDSSGRHSVHSSFIHKLSSLYSFIPKVTCSSLILPTIASEK